VYVGGWGGGEEHTHTAAVKRERPSPPPRTHCPQQHASPTSFNKSSTRLNCRKLRSAPLHAPPTRPFAAATGAFPPAADAFSSPAVCGVDGPAAGVSRVSPPTTTVSCSSAAFAPPPLPPQPQPAHRGRQQLRKRVVVAGRLRSEPLGMAVRQPLMNAMEEAWSLSMSEAGYLVG